MGNAPTGSVKLTFRGQIFPVSGHESRRRHCARPKGSCTIGAYPSPEGLGTRRPFGSRVTVVSGTHEQIGCGVVNRCEALQLSFT